jgi:hypothetical protein
MRTLRRKFFIRATALLLLITILQSTFLANYSWALTTGPHQPEYTSYEQPGATDMVNLLTGDFSLSMPVLEVPGPEGSFSLPLTYNAGIGMEQEASWVGLGWTMNAGSITRAINGNPDDAKGDYQNITVKDLTGVRGWNSNFLGLGQIGWNSMQGHYGAISLLGLLDINYDNGGLTSVGVAGVSVGQNGVHVDPMKLTMAAVTLATLGSGGAAAGLAGVAKQAAWSAAISAVGSLLLPTATPNAPTAGSWEYSKRTQQRLFHKDYWIWLDQNRTEEIYGVLNLDQPQNTSYPTTATNATTLALKVNGNVQTLNQFIPSASGLGSGTASDVNFYMDGSDYQNSNNPFRLATDDFNVGGMGISGGISPYRFDVGSVSTARDMTSSHTRLNPISYATYKVPFLYEGSIANNYFHTVGAATPATTVAQPDFYYGLNHQLVPNSSLTYDLNDLTFDTNQRLRPDVNINKNIPQANHVEWYSNDDIRSTTTPYTNGYIDFLEGTTRTDFRNAQIATHGYGGTRITQVIPGSHLIGGYSITRSDGVTFHYSLPVYDYNQYNHIVNNSDSTNKYSTINRIDPFANTWLLTSVTGPDFIDRNSNGVTDRNDWGYWVKLNYGRHTQAYNWRIPYSGVTSDITNTSSSVSGGDKQLYYLNSIETRSHKALFLKSARSDNKGRNNQNSLRLDEIALLKNEDFDNLILATSSGGCGLTNCTNSYTKEWLSSDITNSTCASQIISTKAIKRIKFSYDYSLCTGILNGTSGKLTLNRISIVGKNEAKIIPDYIFGYGNNPSYDVNKWDAWGMYSSQGTSSVSSHLPSTVTTDATAWSLTTLTNPLGNTMTIGYGRDTYSYVSGQNLQGVSTQLPLFNRPGGNLRVEFIVYQDANRAYKTRYLYGTGVVSREPEYLQVPGYSFYNLPGYPTTPVMYSTVDVLSGNLTNDTDYYTKQTYTFNTPFQSTDVTNSSNMVSVVSDAIANNLTTLETTIPNSQATLVLNTLTKYHHKMDDHTAKVGSLVSIATTGTGFVTGSTSSLQYDVLPANQGVFTESSILAERVVAAGVTYDKMSRTTARKFPYVLISTSTQRNGFYNTTENKKFDFNSGRILETLTTTSLGLKIRTVKVPAYEKYPEMGDKSLSATNKHMLSQDAAEYTYNVDASGNNIGLVQASVQTWKSDWGNYRVFNAGAYQDNSEGANVWRKSTGYFYQGNYGRRQADGTMSFSDTDKFDFTASAANTGWKKSGEIGRYDHFSMPLESIDMNKIRSSVKMGYGDQMKIAEAANAKYTEMAFSGAEDLNTTTNFFGGEVALGAGAVATSGAHTGTKSLQVSSTGKGFIFKPAGVITNKTYRASVWTNSPDGRIYYTLNGASDVVSLVPTLQVGSWYLCNLEIPVSSAFSSLEVGVKSSTGAAILFDDFRFQPVNSSLTSYVYNTATGELQYVLDNDNLFTKYEYNDRGFLIKTYRESIRFNGVKLVSETRDNYKRFNVNQ